VPVRSSTPTTRNGLSSWSCPALQAVLELERVVQLVAEPLRDLGTDHRVVDIGEWRAGGERQRLRASVTEVLEVARVGAHHREAAVRIAEADRHRPGDAGQRGDLAIGIEGHAAARRAGAEDHAHQQFDRPAARTDDQVHAGDAAREGLARLGAHLLDHDQHGRPEADAGDREQRHEAPRAEARPRQRKQRFHEDAAPFSTR